MFCETPREQRGLYSLQSRRSSVPVMLARKSTFHLTNENLTGSFRNTCYFALVRKPEHEEHGSERGGEENLRGDH